jgi:enoyl-CoA hydratase/carnithine racemase
MIDLRSSAELLAHVENGIVSLVLNRPAMRNALSAGLVSDLHRALLASLAGGAKAVVIRASGPHFCAGFDLSGLAEETDDSLLARFVRIELMLQAFCDASIPTVAVAHGAAIGAGADLFSSCTVRIVQGDATFAFPGWKGFGLVLGSARLAGLVGMDRAQAWIASGARVSSDAALAAGLVTERLVDAAAVDECIERSLATHAPTSLRDAINPPGIRQHRLAALVHSAAAPGIKDRLARYVADGDRQATGRSSDERRARL